MTTKILLRPHLAKFITELYGSPVVLPATSEISYWLKLFLHKEFERVPDSLNGMVAVDFKLSENISETIGHTFPSKQFEFFNIVLNRYFNSTTYTMMLHLVREKQMSERKAATQLHTRFGLFDEEYSIEAFRFNFKTKKKSFEEFFGTELPTVNANQSLCIKS
jgi:hypothetical protein